MNRPFYSEYVKHMLRFYTRNPQQPHFKSEVDRNNWFACSTALKGYTDRDRDILMTIYSSFDTLSDSVFDVAKKYKIDQSLVWDMMKDYERKVARKRGLL